MASPVSCESIKAATPARGQRSCLSAHAAKGRKRWQRSRHRDRLVSRLLIFGARSHRRPLFRHHQHPLAVTCQRHLLCKLLALSRHSPKMLGPTFVLLHGTRTTSSSVLFSKPSISHPFY